MSDRPTGHPEAPHTAVAGSTRAYAVVFLLVAMFIRDGAVNNLYGQPKFDDGSVPIDRDRPASEYSLRDGTAPKNL